jgi:ferredoxin
MDVLHKVDSPVDTALILICEKCGKKLSDQGAGDDFARTFQKDLKATFGERYGKNTARAVVSSCMNVCPEGAITVAFAETDGPTTYYTFRPQDLSDAKREIVDQIASLKKS